MLSSPSASCTSASLKHDAKLAAPMLVTVLGSTTRARLKQRLNARSGMEVTPSGMVTSPRGPAAGERRLAEVRQARRQLHAGERAAVGEREVPDGGETPPAE